MLSVAEQTVVLCSAGQWVAVLGKYGLHIVGNRILWAYSGASLQCREVKFSESLNTISVL